MSSFNSPDQSEVVGSVDVHQTLQQVKEVNFQYEVTILHTKFKVIYLH